MENTELQTVEVLPAKPEVPVDVSSELRSKMVNKINQHVEEILESQIELAKGVWVKEYVKDPKTGKYRMDDQGKPITKVYVKPPSENAGQYLLNQVVGKPKENMVVAGKVNFIMDI